MARRVHFCLTPQSKPERLAKQREVVLANKPWLKSTGPKTEDGKRRSGQNRTIHGLHGKEHRSLTRALRRAEELMASMAPEDPEEESSLSSTTQSDDL